MRGVVAAGAAVLLIAGFASPASATTRNFNLNVVGGSISIGSTTNDLGGGPACSDGDDNEYDAPFTPSKDGLIDYPADPECVSPFDNDEKTAGFQQAVPLSLSGTIDDVTGAFNVPASGLTFPDATLTLSSPLVVFVANSANADSAITGTLAPGGTMSFSSLDLSFHIKLCIADFGCTDPPPPYGTVAGNWTANCIVDVNPPNVTSADPAGSPYFAAAGVATVADTDYTLPVPTDDSPAGTLPCAALAGSFGLPDTGADISLQVSTNKAIGQAKSITVGNGSVVEPGPNGAKAGTAKITFPVTVNTPPGTDLTFSLATAGLGATESYKAKPAPTDIDFKSLDGKVGKIKAGKTSGKVAVTVYSDSFTEGDELLLLTVSAPSDPSYTIVHGTALGTIHDRAAANTVSVYGGDVSEGSNAGASPTKPASVAAVFPLVMSAAQLTDTAVTYCTQPITASPNTGKGKTLVVNDYAPVDCAAPKTKVIKAGKLISAISIKVNQDSVKEPDEAFAVVIINVAGSSATANPAASAGIAQIKTDD
jgi:hypothetical protein